MPGSRCEFFGGAKARGVMETYKNQEFSKVGDGFDFTSESQQVAVKGVSIFFF